MESVKFDRERGQILVQVALMVVVLFAFVALALDVGHVYAGRRRMQNAADAGALAGAREICFGGHDSLEAAQNRALEVAEQYAIERNGAHTATVEILDDYTVTVDARQTLDTFFAGVIGINRAPVRAEAAAACGSAVSLAGAFPLAFDFETFSDTVPCGEEFVVFDKDLSDLNCASDPDCCNPEDCDDVDQGCDCCDKYNCGLYGPPMGTGMYGWLDFDKPEDDYLPEYYEPGTCKGSGEGWMECWVRYDYPLEIGPGDCIPIESGFMSAVGDSVNARAGELDKLKFDDGEIYNPYTEIVLWKEYCDHRVIEVYDLGCIEIIKYHSKDDKDDPFEICECSDPDSCKQVVAIEAMRLCETTNPDSFGEHCQTLEGGNVGARGDGTQPLSVSLIQWPPADE